MDPVFGNLGQCFSGSRFSDRVLSPRGCFLLDQCRNRVLQVDLFRQMGQLSDGQFSPGGFGWGQSNQHGLSGLALQQRLAQDQLQDLSWHGHIPCGHLDTNAVPLQP